jgi:hypothetical protein
MGGPVARLQRGKPDAGHFRQIVGQRIASALASDRHFGRTSCTQSNDR